MVTIVITFYYLCFMQNIHYTSIVSVGNSKGIRIPKKFLKYFSDKVIIQFTKKGLVILPDDEEKVPPLKEWDTLFAKAIASGEKPEKDVFEGIGNKTDNTEWEW